MKQSLVLLCLVAAIHAAEGPALYSNDFEKMEVGAVPQDFMVLDGTWAVKEEKGNKCLESPGLPLETYGVLLGPSTNGNVCITAKVYGTTTGRRCPIFGVGLSGVGGYKLQVSPGRRQLELIKGDELVKAFPGAWNTNGWTTLKLQLRKTGENQWAVEGKAWAQGASEPASWTVSCSESALPPAGRASLWATPISGTPVRFDDVVIKSVEP